MKEDAEYSRKSDFSKGEVVRQQIVKCNEIRSNEMTEGYFNYTPEGKKIYVPDNRRKWVAAVKALNNLLSPEIDSADEEMNKKFKKLKKKEKKLFEQYAYQPQKKVWNDQQDKAVWVKIKEAKAYIPETDDTLPGDDPNKPEAESMVGIKGLWNQNVNRYWSEMVVLYDKIYALLNQLIHSNNYFKQGVQW